MGTRQHTDEVTALQLTHCSDSLNSTIEHDNEQVEGRAAFEQGCQRGAAEEARQFLD
jgi:hypothetical protein